MSLLLSFSKFHPTCTVQIFISMVTIQLPYIESNLQLTTQKQGNKDAEQDQGFLQRNLVEIKVILASNFNFNITEQYERIRLDIG